MTKKDIKDRLALLVILYCLPVLFWFAHRNSIYSKQDLYLFVFILGIMSVIPIVVLELAGRYNWRID